MSKFKRVELGDLVRDTVSLFEGVASQKVYYLQGCARFCVTPQGLDKDGKMREGYFVDEPQLKIIKKSLIKVDPQILEETRTGGFCSQTPTK